MRENTDLFARVGTNCPAFYPDFSSGKTCPHVSKATCTNCRNFSSSKKICTIDMFDKVVDAMYLK